MTHSTSTPTTTLTFPADNAFLVTREFRASPAELFDAFTTAEALRQWWGPRDYELRVCDVDLRVGGSYRFVQVGADGQEHAFSGEYREIEPPARLVWTERYEAFADSEHVLTVDLIEQGATTLVRMHAVFAGQLQRDQWVNAGMESGMKETYARLDEYLARPHD